MRFTHLRSVGSGAVTVVYEHDQPKGFVGQKTITASFAFCNPNDRFDRAFGRKVAVSRFASGKTFKVELKGDGSDSNVNISNTLKNFIVEGVNPIKLYFAGKCDDSLLAPRWVQYDVMSEFIEQLRTKQSENDHIQIQSQIQSQIQESSCGSGCCGGSCH